MYLLRAARVQTTDLEAVGQPEVANGRSSSQYAGAAGAPGLVHLWFGGEQWGKSNKKQ